MHRHTKPAPLVVAGLLVTASVAVGCDRESDVGSEENANDAAVVEENIEQDAAESVEDAEKAGEEDKGTAKVTMGDSVWTAERCKARPRASGMKIMCSHTTMKDGKIDRQSLDLMLDGYEGAGEYTSKGMSSRFVGVGMDVDKVKAAEGDDEKSEKVIKDTISGGKVVMMHEAKIKVTKVTDAAIDGTFSWSPSMGYNGPEMKDGTFHAIIDKD